MKKIILIAVGAVLLIGIAGGVALFFLGGDEPGSAPEGAADGEVAVVPATPSDKPAIYVGLDPDFVVAFQNPKHARFIKLSIEVMTRDSDVAEAIDIHMPVIRDAVLMIFSAQDEQMLATREGKEQFRAEILAEIQGILKEHTGDPGVEAVYFTNFVMQ